MGENDSDIKVAGMDWSDLTNPKTFIGRMVKKCREQSNRDYFYECMYSEFLRSVEEDPPRWTFKLVGRLDVSPAGAAFAEKWRAEYAAAAYKSNSRIHFASASPDKKPDSNIEVVTLDEVEEAL